MKTNNLVRIAGAFLLLTAFAAPKAVFAQNSKDDKLTADAEHAKAEFIKADALMQGLFSKSAGYVIFPNIGKGAIGVGGAAGNGIVFENGRATGSAKMKQVSVGFQFGGQAYREVIFFENTAALNRFKENKFEFSAQASAVAVTAGAATNVKYRDGVMVFSQEKKGLMYEASVGGQKFNYTPF